MLWQRSVLISDEHTAARGCKVRLRRDVCLNLHIPRLRRAVSSGISGDGITRKNHASTGSIPQPRKPLHSFSSFLRVIDPRLAVVEVSNYLHQTSQFAQTTLR